MWAYRRVCKSEGRLGPIVPELAVMVLTAGLFSSMPRVPNLLTEGVPQND